MKLQLLKLKHKLIQMNPIIYIQSQLLKFQNHSQNNYHKNRLKRRWNN